MIQLAEHADISSPCVTAPLRFWPEEVRQRVNKTYTYFASGLAVTSLAAYATTRAHSLMRLMATRPLAVSLLDVEPCRHCSAVCCTLCVM